MAAVPLLSYPLTVQDQRVSGFGLSDQNGSGFRVYRSENTQSDSERSDLLWATYRQLFSEHEILESNRPKALESQFKNGSLSVRDFVRALGKSEAFYRLLVEANNNYRLVDLCLKRFLGRASYNEQERIAWSIVIAEQGFSRFVDALIDSQEYETSFGENTVPYQRSRRSERPFNLVTPRYGEDYRDKQPPAKPYWLVRVEQFVPLVAQMGWQPFLALLGSGLGVTVVFYLLALALAR
ncbi:phycobilisome rod-core linker polypeptide [Leptolyngbya sp. FACHB-261]|uniref:phycobilisome rod-core linker polypeptide n=1 Tax=Leptolyngbya sp. FACHB-261 TaxID=2692806 RepID=UPI00168439DA|nr:phycobilisome rod-core linker polypeptide [Leptolyngbya sp. FACHB-261]MBD2104513.1 phycobilisome rod-core linker polypeptide [Leptolyngbya sp. FACHB-261]